MALRHNHYDLAFEEFLRRERRPYVAVDEQRRSLVEDASLKSMDFIVYSDGGRNLLVDVKGRRFPSGGVSRQKWENWATEDDLQSLLNWQRVFGSDFRAALVFAYHITDEKYLNEFDNPFVCRDRAYAFYGVWADEYSIEMRRRSASWETVALSRRTYRELRVPIGAML